jgi:hypothetical protein
MSDRRLFADVLARASPTFKRTLVELRNDQVDPKEHEQAGEAKQDIAEREDQSAGETSGCRSPAKIVKITDVTMETTVTKPRAAQSYASGGALHLLLLVLLGLSWPFLGLGGASNRGSSGYVVVGAAAASTKTSWLSVTLAWVILWRREMK